MSDDLAKRDRDAAKRAIKNMNAARDFPDGTCRASSHVAIMAKTLAKGKKYHMLDSEPEHCAVSMAQTVEALWRYRAKLAKAVELLSHAIDMTGEPHCYHDHHEYCQAHNLEPKGECWVEQSQALLAELTGFKDE